MGQKRILPEHIKSVKHSFEDMSSRIEEKSSSLIDSSATTHLASATDAVKALTKDLVPVIESFDEYLNMVASEFARMDRELGHVIEGSTFQQYANGKSDAEMRKKRYISEKQREIYKQQYSDFP